KLRKPPGGAVSDETYSTDPLLIATLSDHEAFAIFMLEHGADPHAADCQLPVLFHALRKGVSYIHPVTGGAVDEPRLRRPNMRGLVKALLDRGVDPNTRLERHVGGSLDTRGAT